MNKHTHQEYIQKLFDTNKYYRDKELFLLSEYIDSNTPIKVVDRYSNEYLITPLRLLNDHFPSILTCTDKSKHFKQRATLVHNGKFSYENTDYKNANDKVVITCPIHGDFLQRPHSHLAGHGCLKCKDILNGEQKAMPKDEFLQKASSMFGDTYKYDMSTFKSGNVKMTITCPIHGNFEQSPVNHLKGKGCKQCSIDTIANSYRKDEEYFIKRAITKHGDKFDYSLVDYKNNVIPVDIICPTHGVFKQRPNTHYKHGCPLCAKENKIFYGEKYSYTAWGESGRLSPRFESFKLYIIECNNEFGESFIKIGKTYRRLNQRFSKVSMPYNYSVLGIYKSDNHLDISNAESSIKNILSDYRYRPNIVFPGMYECFTKDVLTNSNLESILSKLEIAE